MNSTVPFGAQSSSRRVLLVLGLLGIAALFLPFAYGMSPLSALAGEEDYRLAAPALLAVLVTAGSLRWLAAGALPRLARALAFLVSVGSAAATISLTWGSNWDGSVRDRLSVASPVVILLLGAFLVARRRTSGFAPVMAMQVAYLAHATLCLLSLWPEWQVGAYLVLATATAYAATIALVVTRRGTA